MGRCKTNSQKNKGGKGVEKMGKGEGAGVAHRASNWIRRSRVRLVHVDVSFNASVAGERLELPRA